MNLSMHLIVCCILTAMLEANQAPTITVNITVKTEAGDPIENAPVMAFVQAPRAFGFTDAQGAVTLNALLSEDS